MKFMALLTVTCNKIIDVGVPRCRPMYCDSPLDLPPGVQPVARELRKHLEPLLMVSHEDSTCPREWQRFHFKLII